jgi:hypothetical protein
MNRSKLVAGHLIRQGIAELIKRDYPTWTDESYICLEDLNTYRNKYVREMLETDKGKLSKLETELEIRLLHEKLDHVLTHQWQPLLEIQELQLELMETRAQEKPSRASKEKSQGSLP